MKQSKEEKKYQECKQIISNKSKHSKIEIQKAQQYIDNYKNINNE